MGTNKFERSGPTYFTCVFTLQFIHFMLIHKLHTARPITRIQPNQYKAQSAIDKISKNFIWKVGLEFKDLTSRVDSPSKPLPNFQEYGD